MRISFAGRPGRCAPPPAPPGRPRAGPPPPRHAVLPGPAPDGPGGEARRLASGLATRLSESRTNRTARHVMSRGYDGAPRAGDGRMCEFTSLERCAAYVAARAALAA